MKTYERITNSNQVRQNDYLNDFDVNGDVWNKFQVFEVLEDGITLYCKSKAVIFISNERLANESKIFKRVD